MDESSKFSNPDKGLTWLRATARNGNPNIQYLAGVFAENYEDELKWFTLAADQGHEEAQIKVERITSENENFSKQTVWIYAIFGLISFGLCVILFSMLGIIKNGVNRFLKNNGYLEGAIVGVAFTTAYIEFSELFLSDDFFLSYLNYMILVGIMAILMAFYWIEIGRTLILRLLSITLIRVSTPILLSFGVIFFSFDLCNLLLDDYILRSNFLQNNLLKFIPFTLLFLIIWKFITDNISISIEVEQFNAGVRAANNEDFETSYYKFQPLAEGGDAEAQLLVGEYLTLGLGVDKNHLEAVKLLKNAARQGQEGAYFLLGLIYGNGEILPQDTIEAKKWYQLGADSDDKYSQYNLGCLYMASDGVAEDCEAAIGLLLPLAEQGDLDARLKVGVCYLTANEQMQDYPEAIKHFKIVAEGNQDPSAQTMLSYIYYEGLGTSVDYEQAAKWILLAANQHEPIAQATLGGMYWAGDGVPMDHEEAHRLFVLAAEQGEELGKVGLDLLIESGFPDKYEKELQLQLQLRKHRQEYRGEAMKSVSPETNIIQFPGPRKFRLHHD